MIRDKEVGDAMNAMNESMSDYVDESKRKKKIKHVSKVVIKIEKE